MLTNSDSTILQAGMNKATRDRLDAQIGMIVISFKNY